MRVWAGIAALTLVISLALVAALLRPPGRLVLAAGPPNGAYATIAQRYAAILARDGIALDIVNTAGSVENADLIAAGKVDAALIQGGIPVPGGEVEAIGSVFFETMLFLTRPGLTPPENPALWRGLRITSGAPGSGTAAAFADFEAAVGLDPDANLQLRLPYSAAVAALDRGVADIAVFVSSIDAPYLTAAYESRRIRFLPLHYLPAISRRLDYAQMVTVPTGAISLDPVVPPEPRDVLVLQARLAITPDLHPALVNRLTMAAKELHGRRDLITDQGRFPSIDAGDLPVNNVARDLIQNGPSAWEGLVPYWIAAQVNRTLLLLLPIFLVIVPLLRALPSAYAYVMGWRVWQHYPRIRMIEERIEAVGADADLEALDRQLEEMDDTLLHLPVPAAYRQSAYHARRHIALVREKIEELRAEPATRHDPRPQAAPGAGTGQG